MYISHITVKGFRNFKYSEIEFNDGINVLIGHNYAVKTNKGTKKRVKMMSLNSFSFSRFI